MWQLETKHFNHRYSYIIQVGHIQRFLESIIKYTYPSISKSKQKFLKLNQITEIKHTANIW